MLMILMLYLYIIYHGRYIHLTHSNSHFYIPNFADLNSFLSRLDQRYEAKVKKQGMLMAKKARRIGCPSASVPPADTAAWTIDKQWKNSKFYNELFTMQVTPAYTEISVTVY